MKKVVKFGGSSLASAEQFKKVGDIIRADKSRRYVVPSAPGKRSSSDTKVTDMLYSCYNLAIREKKFTSLLDEIHARYNEIIDGLNLELSLDHEFDMIRENFGKKIGRDYAASRGEYLNGIIMANYLGYEFVDAAKMLRHLLIAELVDLCHQSVKEVTVVRNDDQGAVEIHQRLLEDIFGFHVEVVGRLVQNQEVDRFQQELDHC